MIKKNKTLEINDAGAGMNRLLLGGGRTSTRTFTWFGKTHLVYLFRTVVNPHGARFIEYKTECGLAGLSDGSGLGGGDEIHAKMACRDCWGDGALLRQSAPPNLRRSDVQQKTLA